MRHIVSTQERKALRRPEHVRVCLIYFVRGAPVDTVVAVSPCEAAGSALSAETASAAQATLREHRCVLLRGALAPSLIDDMHREFVAQFGALGKSWAGPQWTA